VIDLEAERAASEERRGMRWTDWMARRLLWDAGWKAGGGANLLTNVATEKWPERDAEKIRAIVDRALEIKRAEAMLEKHPSSLAKERKMGTPKPDPKDLMEMAEIVERLHGEDPDASNRAICRKLVELMPKHPFTALTLSNFKIPEIRERLRGAGEKEDLPESVTPLTPQVELKEEPEQEQDEVGERGDIMIGGDGNAFRASPVSDDKWHVSMRLTCGSDQMMRLASEVSKAVFQTLA